MSLEVIVASATDLPNVESLGKTDPYVSVEYLGIRRACILTVQSFSLALAKLSNPGAAHVSLGNNFTLK